MNKQRWETTIKDENGEPIGVFGRHAGLLDEAAMYRTAGIIQPTVDPNKDNDPAYALAIAQANAMLYTQFGDIVCEVAMARCVKSHKVGPGPKDDFSVYDLAPDEVDDIMEKIMEPMLKERERLAKEAKEKAEKEGKVSEPVDPADVPEIEIEESEPQRPEQEGKAQADKFPVS